MDPLTKRIGNNTTGTAARDAAAASVAFTPTLSSKTDSWLAVWKGGRKVCCAGVCPAGKGVGVAQELGMFPTIEHPQLGTYTTVNIPMRFATADVKPQGPAPQIGEHSEQILRDFGMGDEAIAALKNAGTVGQS